VPPISFLLVEAFLFSTRNAILFACSIFSLTASAAAAQGVPDAPAGYEAHAGPSPEPMYEPALVAPEESPKNTITWNPLSILAGVLSVEYERALTEWLTVFAGPQIQVFPGVFNVPEDSSAFGVGLTAGARFVLYGDAPEGFWISPQFSAAWATATVNGETADGVGFSAGALVGFSWFIGGVFDLSLGLGAGYVNASVTVGGDTIGLEGILPMGRLAIGAAF
jgi:hypothetical protein